MLRTETSGSSGTAHLLTIFVDFHTEAKSMCRLCFRYLGVVEFLAVDSRVNTRTRNLIRHECRIPLRWRDSSLPDTRLSLTCYDD